MESIIPSLICDFYKTSHYNQYPKDTEFLYSTLVPRSNKYLPAVDRVVSINITGFLKKYFVNYFNKFFFERSEDEVVKAALGSHIYTSFVEAKRIEWASYATFVSQWEVDNYLDLY